LRTDSKRKSAHPHSNASVKVHSGHLKRDPDRIAPKKGVLRQMLQERLGEEVGRQYDKDLNSGYLKF
jgi:hypothetical protein